MARNRQLVRELRLLQLLESRHGRTLSELATETNVTTRTIRRDLEALQEAGIALVDTSANASADSSAKRWRVFDWRKEAA